MASVTQKVPNYVLGISTQPDEKKVPGQVTDLVNGVPDVVRQLIKRPGSQLVKEITTTSNPYGDSKTYAVSTAANAKWFSIYTAHDEQYIGQCAADGTVAIWRCSDGASIPVDYADVPGTLKATYLDNQALSDEKSSDIQVLTINETTFFVNRRKNTAMLTGAGDKSPAQLNEAFITLDTISYGKQYALDIFDPDDNTTYTHTRATSIAAKADFVRNISNPTAMGNGDCSFMTRENIVADNVYDSTTSSYVSSGTAYGDRENLRYEIDIRCVPVVDPNNLGGSNSGPQYNDSYQVFAKLQFGGEGWVTGDETQYTTEKNSKGSIKVKTHVATTCSANIAKVRPPATSSSADENISAAGILGGMKTALDAISGTGITSTITGNCLHLTRSTPFAIRAQTIGR